MAIASTPTLLSLDHYAEILGLDPRFFNQTISTVGDIIPPKDCASIWYQFNWMDSGKASREALAWAISQAEVMIANEISFYPAPKFFEDEKHIYPRQDRVITNYGTIYFPGHLKDRRKTLTTQWAYFRSGGRRKVEPMAVNAVIQYLDLDGDGFDETARVVVNYTNASTALAKDGVAVFPTTDTDEINRIRGLKVGLTATQIIIEGQSVQFLDPGLWRSSEVIDGDIPANFLVDVNVYYESCSEEGESFAPVIFEWESGLFIDFLTGYGVLRPRDANLGILIPIPVIWDTTTLEWGAAYFNATSEPYFANLYYRAGFPVDSRGWMSPPFDRAVAALATALLTEPICGCGSAQKLSEYWQEIPARPVTYEQLLCPFGPKRGAWEAWNIVSQYLDLGVALT